MVEILPWQIILPVRYTRLSPPRDIIMVKMEEVGQDPKVESSESTLQDSKFFRFCHNKSGIDE
jgi:hypothetical protein